ncbi:MOSC domain-containing protein [Calidifontibacter sp. DB0510]|uniref:MOSC domain-containing protein n=1 Tax=Metallococcus carri TaxID=1656884 RepID=A0A967AX68_9MICO|nr:MOSC domain-containing protein [Metallococcus carri]NHN54629.1 MOSC domain-containing protein [Metallococcus carri]NOP36532.1 MOSC domain-containing protein [Calidifontibacter sp. DB2511S]
MPSGRVLSVNVGSAEPNGAKATPTGIRKLPVEQIEVRAPGPRRGGLGSGVVGDFIGDRKHHGGDAQAVYAVAREQLDFWGELLERRLDDGWFGENLTIEGFEVDRALMGERWRVGETVLRVSGPRVPCGTFRQHMGVRGWLKAFVTHGLSGAYLAVEQPGVIRPGDQVELLEKPAHDIDLPVVFRAFHGDAEAARRCMDARVLDDEHHAELVEGLRRIGG